MTRKRKHAPAMPESTRILVDVLARTDALWWPSREKFDLRRDQVLTERRRAYSETGLDLPGGGNAAERQSFGRLLGTLEQAGLLTVHQSRGRRVGVKLTPAGDTIARRMVGSYTLSEAWPAFQRCCVWQAFANAHLGGGSWPEHLLIEDEWSGSAADNRRLADVRQELTAVFSAGWILAAGDTAFPRRYWFRVAETAPPGLPADTATCPVANAPEGAEFSQTAADAYDAERNRYIGELADAEPEHPSDLIIPLPSGVCWGSLDALTAAHAARQEVST